MSKVQLRVTTGSRSRAGTDDGVWVDLGALRLRLDNTAIDDFERGDTNVFTFDIPRLDRSGIWRFEIVKSPDGEYGGWLLDAVQLALDGEVVHKRSAIVRWIQDDARDWIDRTFEPLGPAPRLLRVSEADVEGAIEAAVRQAAAAGKLKGLKVRSVDVRLEPGGMRITVKGTKSVDGPNPDITVTLRYAEPKVAGGRIELEARSVDVDVDFPWWFDVLTAGVALIVGEIKAGSLESSIERAATTLLEDELTARFGTAAANVRHVRYFPRALEVALDG